MKVSCDRVNSFRNRLKDASLVTCPRPLHIPRHTPHYSCTNRATGAPMYLSEQGIVASAYIWLGSIKCWKVLSYEAPNVDDCAPLQAARAPRYCSSTDSEPPHTTGATTSPSLQRSIACTPLTCLVRLLHSYKIYLCTPGLGNGRDCKNVNGFRVPLSHCSVQHAT